MDLKKSSFIFTVLLLKTLTYAQHPNIVVDNSGDADEPSISMDIKNPSRMVAGANIANIYYSNDTGRTWAKQIQNSSFGVWGDPVLASDTEGAFYHFHLSNPSDGNWIDRIVCQKSTDGGKTWNNGSFMGLNGTKNQDKHWVTIDRKTNTIYCTWTQFDKYESQSPQDSSHILFSKSVDGGLSWTPTQRINQFGGDCLDDDNTTEGAVPTLGTNGELYVTWAGPKGLMFDKSLDKGATWLKNDIKVSDIGGGWTYNVPSIYRCNGLPITICDTSNSPNRGTIYVNWSDQRNGETNTDIWLAKSKDGGNTWAAPKKVNTDNSNKHQFMTWMTVDQTNGNLWFVFYDRRNYVSDSTDVYMAFSKDGGETFQNFKISEQPFKPNGSEFFGDYTNVVAHNNIVRPIWTAMNPSGKKTIYTALINTQLVTNTTNTEGVIRSKNILQTSCYPNPVDSQLVINFDLVEPKKLCIKIFDISGKMVSEVLKKKEFKEGKNEAIIDIKSLNLPSGTYTYLIEGKWGRDLASNRFVVVR
jgi:Secretion system C-terminal sorting domain